MLVDELVQKITIQADTKALDIVQKKEKSLIATTATLDGAFKSAFRWLGGALLIRTVFNATMQLDSLTRSFNALAGTSEKGAEEIRFLREEAERLGQSFPSIASAYKGLFATGMGAGLETGVIRGVFSSLLEASAVLGTSQQETESAIIALQQMLSKGRVMTQELRLQLGNALPGAFQIASQAMGVTTAELEEMVSKGLDAKDFVQKFGAELHRQFGGEKLQGSIHSIRAEFTRLKNALFDIKTGILSGETGKAVSQMIKSLTDFAKSTFAKSTLKAIAVALGLIFKNLKLITSMYIIHKISALTASMKLLTKAGWASIIPFAKLGLAIVAIHDLITALFDEDLLNKYADFIDKHPVLARISNPAVPVGEVIAHGVDVVEKMNARSPTGTSALSGMAMGAGEAEASLDLMQLMANRSNPPEITINQNISTNASPTDIAEKTKEALTGAFRQYNYGGNR